MFVLVRCRFEVLPRGDKLLDRLDGKTYEAERCRAVDELFVRNLQRTTVGCLVAYLVVIGNDADEPCAPLVGAIEIAHFEEVNFAPLPARLAVLLGGEYVCYFCHFSLKPFVALLSVRPFPHCRLCRASRSFGGNAGKSGGFNLTGWVRLVTAPPCA